MRSGRVFTIALCSLVAALALISTSVLLPMVSAGTPLSQGDLTPTAFAYLPYVARQHPEPAPTSPLPGPLPPALVSPADGATLSTICPSFSIDNSAIGEPAGAQVQVALVPDFSSGVSGFLIGPFEGSMTVPLYWNLSPGTTYYWRARSSFDEIDWGEWSEVWSFTTASGGELPGAPVLISPADESTVGSLRPALAWSSVSGATRYAVAITGYVLFSSSSEYTVPFELDPNTTYAWSVSARNDYGWGAGSSEWSFTTPSARGRSSGASAGIAEPFFDLRAEQVTLWSVP